METYLLDANIISDFGNEKSDYHAICRARLKAAAEAGARVILPVMAIAEIEFGLHVGGMPDSELAQTIRRFFQDFQHEAFDDGTIEPYALIRAQLFQLHGRRKGKHKGFKEKRPEELRDRVTGKELGIDERDLLIASVAIEYNCVLVTDDSNLGMRRIREAADYLAADGHPTQLRVENWRKA
jgi:predicted nucleic acid-binding protein